MTSTPDAAKKLGITPGAFRKRARKAGIKAEQVFLSGKRGRPADYWTEEQVAKVSKARK